jgi:hypothetical protein
MLTWCDKATAAFPTTRSTAAGAIKDKLTTPTNIDVICSPETALYDQP